MSSYTSFYGLANPEYYQMEKRRLMRLKNYDIKTILYIKKDKSNTRNYKDRKK